MRYSCGANRGSPPPYLEFWSWIDANQQCFKFLIVLQLFSIVLIFLTKSRFEANKGEPLHFKFEVGKVWINWVIIIFQCIRRFYAI